MSGLLPPNQTLLEDLLERVGERNTSVYFNMADLWNPATCPVELLAWVAWGFSADYWNPLASEASKRLTVATAFEVHRQKGTVGAVRLALESLGLGRVFIRSRGANVASEPLLQLPFTFEGNNQEYAIVVNESIGDAIRNGSIDRDGTFTRGSSDSWATYNLTINRPISISQANSIRQVLADVAPARCFLKEINYTEANNIRNGAIHRDGTFTRGVA